MSDVSEHSEFDYLGKKKQTKKKEKRSGHIIKCLLTELGWAGQEDIWHSVMAHGPRCAWSLCHDLGPNIFLSGPPTQSISTYFVSRKKLFLKEVFFIYFLFFNNCNNNNNNNL